MVTAYVILAIFLSVGHSKSQENEDGQGTDEEKPLCCDKLSDGSFSSNCQRTKLWAGFNEGYASTPNFPERFPILKKCIWEIYSQPDRRIYVDFLDFYLIGPGDDGVCHSQNVVIIAPLSGSRVGPHCGNAGIPSVVSAGNFLIVELISNIPMTSENFRGFRMAFRETSESPSRGLVSQNMKDDVPIPEDLAIGKPGVKNKNTLPTERTKSTTKRPWRVRLSDRLPTLLPPVGTRPKLPDRKRESENSSLSPMVIVGIAAGGIVLLSLAVTFGMKACNIRKQRRKNNAVRTVSSAPAVTMTTADAQTVPEYYYVYYYQNPYIQHGRGKHRREKRQNASERKIKKKDKREKRHPNGEYLLKTVSNNLTDPGSRKSYSHNIKPAKVRKAVSIAPPLSINPSNRRLAKSTKINSRKALKELKNATILVQNTVAKAEKPISAATPHHKSTHTHSSMKATPRKAGEF